MLRYIPSSCVRSRSFVNGLATLHGFDSAIDHFSVGHPDAPARAARERPATHLQSMMEMCGQVHPRSNGAIMGNPRTKVSPT
jgi:hypothetical protein